MGTILCLALILINAAGALLTIVGALTVFTWTQTRGNTKK